MRILLRINGAHIELAKFPVKWIGLAVLRAVITSLFGGRPLLKATIR
jgi:hypothetical protein